MTETKKTTASSRTDDTVNVETGSEAWPPIEPVPAPLAPYYPLPPGAIVEAGAAHSLAGLFEGMVQNQLYASNILAATTARCVNHILEGGARTRAETLEMFRET
jgi:hypothetical protein